MGRIIDRKDIRKGDKLVIHRTVEVATDLDSEGDFKDQEGYWVLVSEYRPEDQYVFEVFSRPNPALPTQPGSVVHVLPMKQDDSEQKNWLLMAGGELISSVGDRMTRQQFTQWIEDEGREFEVIA